MWVTPLSGAADVMVMLLAIGFMLLHMALVLSVPAHAMAVSYAFLVAAPLLACGAASRQVWLTNAAPSNGWSLLALSMLLWTLGMISSLREDIFLSNNNQVPGESMLLYMLYGIPIFYAVATIDVNETRVLRAIDAVLVASLGYLYYALMFSLTTLRGATNPHSAQMISVMFDAENAFLAITTSIRFFAADTLERRRLFGSMAAFTCVYAGTAAYYNHHVALDLGIDVGSAYDIIIDVPFLMFAALVSHASSKTADPPSPHISLVRFVRSGSPLLLALAVLFIALLLLRHQFALGVAGVVVAVFGYGLRSILSQVHQIETEDELRSDRVALAKLAMRDSLTSVANRRAFEEALERE